MDTPNYVVEQPATPPPVACGNCERTLPGPRVPAQCPYCGAQQTYNGWTVLTPILPDLGRGNLVVKALRVFSLAPRASVILLGLQILIAVAVAVVTQIAYPTFSDGNLIVRRSNTGASSIVQALGIVVLLIDCGLLATLTKIWASSVTGKPLTIAEGAERAKSEFFSYIGAFILGTIFAALVAMGVALVTFIPAIIASVDSWRDISYSFDPYSTGTTLLPVSVLTQFVTPAIILAFVIVVGVTSYLQTRWLGFLFPILMLERLQNTAATSRSWRMTRGSMGWTFFAVTVVVGLIFSGLAVLLTLAGVLVLPTLIGGLGSAYLAAFGFAAYIEARKAEPTVA